MLKSLFSIAALGLGACMGNIGGSDEAATHDGPDPDPTDFKCDPLAAKATASPIRRLPKLYFENSLREFVSTLDVDTRETLISSLQTRLDLIPNDIGARFDTSDDSVAQDHVDAVFGVAVSLASKVADDSAPYASALLAPCGTGKDKSALDEDACLTAFVEHYGRKALRRPLTSDETSDFKAFYTEAKSAGVDGLGMLMGRFVAHPSFYYRFDFDGEVESGSEGKDALYALTKWELLSKVTFLFWAGPPTDALYDKVEAMDLTSDQELAALVDEVLNDARAEEGVLRFYREWLELDETKMPATEGNTLAGQAMVKAVGLDALPSTHREDMIREVLDLTKHYTLSTEGKLGDIFTSTTSFAKTPALAAIYGVEPWDGDPDNLVSLPSGERSGLLTRAAFVSSSADYTRPIIKGKTIRTQILCQDIPPPPPELEIKPLTHPVDRTTRQAVELSTEATACQACHTELNGLGFLSENYDPIGAFRKEELRFTEGTDEVSARLALDTEAIAGITDDDQKVLSNAIDLGEHLASSEVAPSCMVLNYFEFAVGREPNPITDGCDLVEMRDEHEREAGSLRAMLRASAMQRSFRHRLIK